MRLAPDYDALDVANKVLLLCSCYVHEMLLLTCSYKTVINFVILFSFFRSASYKLNCLEVTSSMEIVHCYD